MTKYIKLRSLGSKRLAQKEQYKEDCANFIGSFHQKFVEYLECSGDCIQWHPFSESELDLLQGAITEISIIKAAPEDKMLLLADASWLFTFLIRLGHSKGVFFRPTVKKVDDKFIVKLNRTEHTIHQDSKQDMGDLVGAVYKEVHDYLENDFDNFVRGTSRHLGFKTKDL